MIDIIAIIIILFYVHWGLKKGLSGILLDLLILAVSALAAWYYYRNTGKLINSILFFWTASIGLSVLKWLFSRSIKKPSKEGPYLFNSNHILGANIGLVLGVIIVAFLFVLIDILPVNLSGWNNFKQRLCSSKSYKLTKRFIPLNKIRVLGNLKTVNLIINDPRLAERLRQQPEFKSILENENVKAIAQDPQIIEQLKNKDYSSLLKNPKVSKLLNDPELIGKILKIDYEKILAEGKQ